MFSKYDDIVTIDEIMEMLQIGRVTVYQMLQSGRIRRLRIGKRYIIPKQSIVELFEFGRGRRNAVTGKVNQTDCN